MGIQGFTYWLHKTYPKAFETGDVSGSQKKSFDHLYLDLNGAPLPFLSSSNSHSRLQLSMQATFTTGFTWGRKMRTIS
jgi:5'-3' exonuclease